MTLRSFVTCWNTSDSGEFALAKKSRQNPQTSLTVLFSPFPPVAPEAAAGAGAGADIRGSSGILEAGSRLTTSLFGARGFKRRAWQGRAAVRGASASWNPRTRARSSGPPRDRRVGRESAFPGREHTPAGYFQLPANAPVPDPLSDIQTCGTILIE